MPTDLSRGRILQLTPPSPPEPTAGSGLEYGRRYAQRVLCVRSRGGEGVTRLHRLAAWVERALIPLLVVSVAVAFLAPGTLSRAHGAVLPLFAAMMFAVSLTFHAGDVAEAARDPLGIAMALGLSLLPLSAAAFAWGPSVVDPGGPAGLSGATLVTGLALYGALPTDISAPLFTALARGNTALAAVSNAVITALSPVLLPVWFLTLTGVVLKVPLVSLVLELVGIVVFPTLAGVLLRTRSRALAQLDALFEAAASLLYLVLVAIVVAQERDSLLRMPASLTLRVIVAVIAVNVAGYALGALAWAVSRRRPRDLSAYVFVVGEREFSVAVAVVYAGGLSPLLLVPAILGAVVQAITAAALARLFRVRASHAS